MTISTHAFPGDCTCRPTSPSWPNSHWSTWLNTTVGTLLRWHAMARQRQALLDLDDHLLDDIGVTREQAERASAELLWRTYARRHLK